MRPETNDDYEVLDFIGRGGYGEVFLARDRAGRFWAVKVVYRVSFDHNRPFEREFEGISKFEPISRLSESQLQILHVGRRDGAGYFYYIMELADDMARGRDIRPAEYSPRTLKSDLQTRGRLAPLECCRIASALAVALENLHQHRLVHRDIKPGNIIFVNGQPKLADPGLVTDADKSMTCAGTEGYIPPKGPGTIRADIYSLGIVLYEAMTGNTRWDFPKLPENFEEWPEHKAALELNRIINKACHAKLRKRYQSARELTRDLERLAQGKPSGRRKKLALIGFATLAVMGLVWGLTENLRHRGPASASGQYVFPGRVPETVSVLTNAATTNASAAILSQSEPKDLKDALASYTWQWNKPGYPSLVVRFHDDGTFYDNWHYWVVGPRTMHVQFWTNIYDANDGADFTFDESLSEFSGGYRNGKIRHSITGKRLEAQ